MILAIIDAYNDCSFSLKIADESSKETVDKVKKYMLEGLDAWYCAAHTPVDYEGTLFSCEEVANFYDLGYAEPTEILLGRDGIGYELVDMNESSDEDDEDDCEVNADEVLYYQGLVRCGR